MRKFTIILLLLFLRCSRIAWADSDKFNATSNITYKIDKTGLTTITANNKIVNLTSNYYATEYSSTISNAQVESVSAYDQAGSLPTTLTNSGEMDQTIKVKFIRPVVGKDMVLNWSLVTTSQKIAVKVGRVWEITLPKIDKDQPITSETVRLKVPEEFGQALVFKPPPQKQDKNGYLWDVADLSKNGMAAIFGGYQLYDFTIKYQIENPQVLFADFPIALVPTTNSQSVLLDSLDPPPKKSYVDPDGNWLASYRLGPKQSLEITAKGKIRVDLSTLEPQATASAEKSYLGADKFWETDNPEIIKKAQELKTPQEIFRFVVSKLTYDKKRISLNLPRIGAKEALNKPESALCVEFTDLFIAIARAAGIPSREVNGYAYTYDEKQKPVSLNRDSLHAWPEYFDREKGGWFMVDPTWENTTGGLDFFQKLDLNHIVFVRHGLDSQHPLAAGLYKNTGLEKNVSVNISSSTASADFKSRFDQLSFLPPRWDNGTVTIVVKNVGQTVVKGSPLLDNLVPFGETKIQANIKDIPGVWWKTAIIKVPVLDGVYEGKITIPPFWISVPYPQLGAMGCFIALAIWAIATKKWRISLPRQRS